MTLPEVPKPDMGRNVTTARPIATQTDSWKTFEAELKPLDLRTHFWVSRNANPLEFGRKPSTLHSNRVSL